uniref:SapC family protein n=1 Tax=Macrostomum lignano TaxID=282301 RepID=A0A1I8INV2_9PLAT
MLLDKTESSFAPVLAAEKQHQLLVSGRKQALLSHLPLLSLLNAIDAQCWHPGLTLVTEPTAGRLYAYFRPLEGLDQHPLDQFWQFEPQLDLLPEAAEHLAAQVLAEIEGTPCGSRLSIPADGRPLAFPLSRQHADLTAAELSELERPVELADWPQLAPHLSSLSAELTVGLAVLAVSADGAAASLRLVNERMPERYR